MDYEFSTFGGASAENFYLLDGDKLFSFDCIKDEKERDQIFNVLKIHPQSFVVMDNDLCL